MISSAAEKCNALQGEWIHLAHRKRFLPSSTGKFVDVRIKNVYDEESTYFVSQHNQVDVDTLDTFSQAPRTV